MSTKHQQSHDILAFCHIIKTAGTSFTDLLKDNFGAAHLSVEPHKGSELYTQRELQRDLRCMPWLKSLAGHGLRPYIDYGIYSQRLKWITWFRDPVARLISGYQHGVEKNGLKTPFEIWLQEPGHKNLHVYFLTGNTDDLEGAKEILTSKKFFIGFVEQFEQSLSRLQDHFPADNLDFNYTKRSNTAIKATTAKDIYQNIERYRDLIDQNTSLDLELYQWALNQQSLSTGIETTKHIETIDPRDLTNKSKTSKQINSIASTAIRHLFYKPVLSKI